MSLNIIYKQHVFNYLSFELMSSTCYYEKEKDKQCTYNVTVRHVRATIVAVKLNKYNIFWVCICSLGYTPCKTHEPYCHLRACPTPQYVSILSHKRFSKKKTPVIEHKMFWLSLQLFSETFLILRRTERHTIKKMYWFPCKVPVILVRF
jgi:adenine-specific DNA glycosylase